MLCKFIRHREQQKRHDDVLEKSNYIIVTYGSYDELNSQKHIFSTTKDPRQNQAHDDNVN